MIIQAAIFAGVFIAGAATGAGAVKLWKDAEITQMKLAASEQAVADSNSILTASLSNSKLINKLEVSKNEANNVIDHLTNQPRRVPKLPTCPAIIAQTQPSAGSVSAVEPARSLSGAVESIIDADRQRTVRIVRGAEVELNECRVAKAWAAAQGDIK